MSDGGVREMSDGGVREMSDGGVREMSDGGVREMSDGGVREMRNRHTPHTAPIVPHHCCGPYCYWGTAATLTWTDLERERGVGDMTWTDMEREREGWGI